MVATVKAIVSRERCKSRVLASRLNSAALSVAVLPKPSNSTTPDDNSDRGIGRVLIDDAALVGIEIPAVALTAPYRDLQVGEKLLARRLHVDLVELCGILGLLERAVLVERDADRFLESDHARVLRAAEAPHTSITATMIVVKALFIAQGLDRIE